MSINNFLIMSKLKVQILFIFVIVLLNSCINNKDRGLISPNQFKGSDIQRIQSAINAAEGTTNKVVIPSVNSNGTNIWLIDHAILVPGNMTIILDNCTIQLSDSCRDNMFRSNNAGIGIKEPEWNYNINITGIGKVVLKGADNPRSTGDARRTLSLSPQKGRVSYGSDAGKEEAKQTGDWRNIMILMACVDGFTLKNVNIENAHAWALCFERTLNADLSDINISCPDSQIINGNSVFIANRDGIDLLHGCKNFRINNVSGNTGDDFIALSLIGIHTENADGGSLNSTMVTTMIWRGPEDDIEQIYINNIECRSNYRGIAIRADDHASVNNVFINGLMYHGDMNAILVGGKGYGKPSLPGKINNIHVMNIIGKGRYLIHIEEAIADCSFMNGIYYGTGNVVTYNLDKNSVPNAISDIDKDKARNVTLLNMIKIP